MSLFERLKKVISAVQEKSSTITKYNGYVPEFTIEDWQPKIKIPEYDAIFSLNKYLDSIDLPPSTVQRVMNSNNPFGEAKNLFNGLKEKVEWSDMCWREAVRMEHWIKVLSLSEAPPERILESTFMYLLLRLGWECHWDTLKQKALNPDGLNYAFEACRNNDYARLLKVVDSDILSCFALAHIRSGKKLTEIVNTCFTYLDMNTTHNGSAQGSFYNLYGKAQIKSLIGKIIESAYTVNKFSLKTLFFKESAFENIDNKALKYDILKMRKDRTVYLPNIDDKENIICDVLSLNIYIEEANKLIGNKIGINISRNDIVFYFGKALQEVRDFCFFTYSPNTPTGKASKYPISLNFYCNRKSEEKYKKNGTSLMIIPADGISGNIDYLLNGELGKSRIIINYKGSSFIIYVMDKQGKKNISKIEEIKNSQKNILYNANKQ